jgi:curli biogenesis system outer membrane secretion channel CsgG
MNKITSALLLAASIAFAGCRVTESSRTIQSPTVTTANAAVHNQHQKVLISIAKFDNRSSDMRGVFSTTNDDRLGSQARTILETHLQQTGYFSVLNRDNLSELKQEIGYSQVAQSIKVARYVVTGDVTEFGRKAVGDQQLFGILGRGKQQVAYAKFQLEHRRCTKLRSGIFHPRCW